MSSKGRKPYRRSSAVVIRCTALALLFGPWAGIAGGQCNYEVSAVLEAPVSCGILGPALTEPTAINDHGVVTGYYNCIAGTPRPFIWSEEMGFVAIPLPPGISEATPADINDNNEIVGMVNNHTSGGVRGFLFADGEWITFTPLNGNIADQSVALAVNDNTEVMGTRGSPGPLGFHWHKGIFTDIPSPIGGTVRGFAINTTGIAAGQLSGPDHAFWWDGVVHDLGTLLGGDSARAEGITTRNELAGGASLPKERGQLVGSSRAILWKEGAVTNLGIVAGSEHSHALDLNETLQVVGISSGGGLVPFFWQHGEIHDIRDLVINPQPDLILQRAIGITNDGKILVKGQKVSVGDVGFLLTPIGSMLGDVNIDCVVDERDLVAVLDDWAPQGGKEGHRTDIVSSASFQPPGDGRVDAADLAVVLGNWTITVSEPKSERGQQ